MQRLRDIELQEVSFVDNPAEPNATIHFFKMDSEIEKSPRMFSMERREVLADEGKAMPDGSFPIPDKDALRRAIMSIGRTGSGRRAAVRRHIIRRARALGALDMVPNAWKIGGGGMTVEKSFLRKAAEALGFVVDDDTPLEDIDKALAEVDVEQMVGTSDGDTYSSGDTEADHGGNMANELDLTSVPADVVAYIEKLKEERDEALAKAESASTAVDEVVTEDTEEDVLKNADPSVLEYIRKAEARAAEAENIAKAEREMRLKREYLEKSNSLPYVGEERSDLAELLRAIADQVDGNTVTKLEQVLKAANEQIAQSELFKEAGMAGAGTTGDAYRQLESIAAHIAKENGITAEAAFTKALEQRPDLYERYLTESEV